MTESPHESTFIHFLRGSVLLTALIAVPGMAVCWNMIPKAFVQPEEIEDFSPEASNPTPHDLSELPSNKEEKTDSEPMRETPTEFFQGSVADPLAQAMEQPRPIFEDNGPVQRMGNIADGTEDRRISSAFSPKNAVLASQVAESAPKIARQAEPSAQRSFPVLENRLKQLGAKYYRLEKWGNQGNLFRFSCYVSASSPHEFQKHFQAIDSDELRVMENVIAQIEQWKNAGSRTTP